MLNAIAGGANAAQYNGRKQMTYYVTAYNTHPKTGHIKTIAKTMQTSCKEAASMVAGLWALAGYKVESRIEG